MEWEFPWKSHGNGSSFRASDGNGNGDMGMAMTYFVCAKKSHTDV